MTSLKFARVIHFLEPVLVIVELYKVPVAVENAKNEVKVLMEVRRTGVLPVRLFDFQFEKKKRCRIF